MSTTRTSSARRPLPFGRRAVVALTVGAGMALTPLPALAADGPTTAAVQAAPVAAPTAAAQVAVDTALAQLGDPYVWGGAGPNSFDCSGLTQYAYGAAGVYLPHSSRMQVGHGVPVASPTCSPVTWSSSTARSATSACTSATGRWCTRRRRATS